MAAACWSLLALLTGGVALGLGPLHFSSRNPRNPALVAALTLLVAWALAEAPGRNRQIARDLNWFADRLRAGLRSVWRAWTQASRWLETRLPSAVAPTLAIAIAATIVGTSIRQTAFVAAGSDAWGYVSQAHLWATGTLRPPQPLLAELSGFVPREAMAPLAYRPSPQGATIVPVTSPGLPMLMALFELAGGPPAVFAVVPLLAALAVWATYLLGRELDGRWTGVVAAALLATSPAFLYQLTAAPMSDIPAAAAWTLSLVFALRTGARAAVLSGITAGVAILIRANLAPIAIVPAAIVLLGQPHGRRRVAFFAAGVIPAVLGIAVLYTYWYGSPLNSGYGTLDQLYSAANLLPNLSHYVQWLPESQTPVILAAAVAPFLIGNRAAALGLLAFTLAVIGCYIFYIPFDAWWYLRFLLPAYPAMLVLTAASLLAIVRRLPRQLQAVVTVIALALIVRHSITYAAARATFDSGGEQKYAITGQYVAEHLPENAVIFAEQHSGGIRYYSGRTTIRFGSIPSDHLEGAIAELHRRGYRPYLVAEDWEEEAFRRQFAGRGILSALENGPDAELPLGKVRIYPLAR